MIEIKGLKKLFNPNKENEFVALKNISLQIQDSELVAIMGKSGAGKSTLLHILSCIDDYEEGEYYLDGIRIQKLSEREAAQIRNEKIGIVMQDFALVEEFSALENVLLPLDFSKKKIKNKLERAYEALEQVEMEEQAEQEVSSMSGGEKQRVAIARAIVNNPTVILADEPTGSLDSQTADNIMKLFLKLHGQGKTVIIVTHDRAVAEQCDRIIEIRDGEIVEREGVQQ